MRCLALAQAWQDRGGRVIFAAADLPAGLGERLAAESCASEAVRAAPGSPADATETASLANSAGASWVVIDGYHFGAAFQQRVKDTGTKVLAIDDYGHAGSYSADLVLNQNLGATDAPYRQRGPQTRLLLGTRYALLRREFLLYRWRKRDVPAVGRKVLVTLGGTDPDNVTLKVIRALDRVSIPGLDTIVVLGSGNPHQGELEAVARRSRASIDLRVNVANMPDLMAWADLAITAGGTTSWERALVGLPSLTLVLADNQAPVAAACDAAGLTRCLGWHAAVPETDLAAAVEALLGDSAARAAMACRGQQAVDGRGAARVVRTMAGAPAVSLRPAGQDDARMIWEWANDPEVRTRSFTGAPIPWADHQTWYARKRADPHCTFFIALDEGEAPIGQIRFDQAEAEAVVSVSLAPAARGRGYGTAVIHAGCRAVLDEHPTRPVVALIREGNEASVQAFARAGFTPDGTTTVNDLPALRFVLKQ
jgi:UDP-2,4-diacetamido-2,4,6-trideoxy-beta-L-altropyranose hydrolase